MQLPAAVARDLCSQPRLPELVKDTKPALSLNPQQEHLQTSPLRFRFRTKQQPQPSPE